jgi:hypothetical protein
MHHTIDQLMRLLPTLRSFRVLQLFTIYTRYLIGVAFVFAAFNMGKFSGPWTPGFSAEQLEHIARMGGEVKPIGEIEPFFQFWRVMATSGLYWKFIGASQVLAGALLMTQRFAKLGAMMFLGIITNIFVVTVAYSFEGTPVITGLMLLAAVYLLAWDLDSFQPLFRSPDRVTRVEPESGWISSPFWAWLGALLVAVVTAEYMLGVNPFIQGCSVFVIGLVGLLIFLAGTLRASRRMAGPRALA